MILAIVQARMSSARLPGKVMKQVLGKPLIGYLLERLAFSTRIDKIMVATPEDTINDGLCEYVKSQGYDVYRGPEQDVLARYYQAAKKFQPDGIVRVTADCPLIDPEVVDRVIQYYLDHQLDYVCNGNPPTFPDGLDTEVFSFATLERAFREAEEDSDREHVTSYMRNSGKFKIGNVEAERDYSHERWTLDYPEDFNLIENIIINVIQKQKNSGMQEILRYKEQHVDIFEVNQHLCSR